MRLKRIVSDPIQLHKRLNQFIEYFVCSGYQRKSLKSTANQVLSMESENESASRKEHTNAPCLIATFNKSVPLNKLVNKHWPITQTTKKCRDALPEEPRIVFRRNKNLSDLLVRAKYRSGTGIIVPKMTHSVRKCNHCSWCKNVTEATDFYSATTGQRFKIYHKMTCTSPWVVYLAECNIHKKQYVGKSETKLNIRMNNNRNHLKLPSPMCKLVQHFKNSTTCNMETDMILTPIEQLKSYANAPTAKETLHRREIFWQNKLSTFEPSGLNKREG